MELTSLLKKGAVVLLAKLVGTALSFLFVFLLARFLGVSDFGAYFLLFTIISIAAVFSKWGLDIFLLKKVASEKKKSFFEVKRYVYSSLVFVFVLSFLLMLILKGMIPVLSNVLFDSIKIVKAFELFLWSIIPFSLMYVASESFKSIGRPVLAILLQNIIIPFISILFLLVMYYFYKVSLNVAVIGYLIGVLFAFILTVVFIVKEYPYESFKRVSFKKLYYLGQPMLLISSGALIMSWTDILVLGVFETEFEVGVYVVATKIVVLTSLVLVAMNAITSPKYASLYSEGRLKELAKLAQKSSLVLLIIAISSSVFIFIFSEELMSIFGSEFIVGAEVLVVLAVGQFVNVSCGSVGFLLIMTGKENVMRNILLSTAVINIILSLLLVKFFGILGVAYATALSMILWNIWAMIEVKKSLGFWSFSLFLFKS